MVAMIDGAPVFAAHRIYVRFSTVRLGSLARASLAVAIGLTVANCASQPTGGSKSGASREIGAFTHKKYGQASPRVIADGAEVPKGGGRYLVGNSYSIAGRTYTPSDRLVGHAQVGLASWYGAAFHGRKTANGEVYDRMSYTAAHPTMPLPSYARVTNTRNGNSIIVRVNDRGPYHGGRVMDVSERVANALAFKGEGTTRVRIDYLGKAGLGGSDDTRLAASLRTDGSPASSPSIPASSGNAVLVAAAPAEPVASSAPVQAAAFSPRRAPVATPMPTQFDPVPAREAAPLPARGAPVPPSRPFDLGTIPGAGSPVPTVAPTRPASPQRTASLSFAPQTTGLSSFQQGNPLAALPPARFVAKAK